jgi:hypothetical protein
MKNWVRGNRRPNIPMNGMVPPQPIWSASFPYTVSEARLIDCSNHDTIDGAFHPSDGGSH